MKRRDFTKYGGAAALGASLGVSTAIGQERTKAKVKAKDVQDFLRGLNGGWMHLEETCDTFKAGTPETEVTGIAVGWMSYTWALKLALKQGQNLFITHEPTYYDHWDDNPEMFEIDGVPAKKKFIEDSGLVIIRCHDLWDQYPEIGITDGWATLLGFEDPVYGDGYFRVFEFEDRTAGDIARQVAARVAPLGQEAVQLIGSPDQPIKRVAIGCGGNTPYRRFLTELKADLAICSDDGFTYWRDGALAIDLGLPVIVVNHPLSEEHGMKLLSILLEDQFPDVPVTHIPQRCMYRLVRA